MSPPVFSLVALAVLGLSEKNYLKTQIYIETRWKGFNKSIKIKESNRINDILGHSLILHSAVFVGWPVQVPPFASITFFVRVSVRVPVPQSAEHLPLTQGFHSQ